MNVSIFRLIAVAFGSTVLLIGVTPLYAQNKGSKNVQQSVLEEVITIGTRRKDRSVTDSPVPIDVLSAQELASLTTGDMQEALQAVSPSFNVGLFPANDGTSFVRVPTLRGLPGGEVLVLVNGKRHHRSALVSLNGSAATKGSHGVDISQIPSVAVKRIEILRDGAAAQYGSDAIAGVINVVLKDSEGISGSLQNGQYFEGDGTQYKLDTNIGVALSGSGFFNVGFQYVRADPTSRGVQRADAQRYIDAGNTTVRNPAQIWGSTDRESYRMVYNAVVDLGEKTEAYSFGNYGDSRQNGDFFYRNLTRSVYNRSIYQDTHPDPVFRNFDLTTVYPGGFTPRFYGEITDYSFNAGVRGDTDSGLIWDTSATTGSHEIEYYIENTFNPSLGPVSPTSFKPGGLQQTEHQINADISYPLNVNFLSDPINIAVGLEFRKEVYEIIQGELASYQIGEFRDLAVGSNGFPGYGPSDAGKYDRHNVAAYMDIEADLNEHFTLGIAARYEDFSDFGSTSTGKIAARYQINEAVAVRSAVSTGFRAPTLGQSYTTVTQTDAGGATPVARGVIPSVSPVAAFFGGKPLEPENATNISAGVIFEPIDDLSLTIDYYNIKITDRIAQTGNFIVTDEVRAQLIANNVPGASEIESLNFFSNGYDTRTTGVDFVASYDYTLENNSLINFSLGYSHHNTDLLEYDPNLFNRQAREDLQVTVPNDKATATVKYRTPSLQFLVRARYFGSFTDARNVPEDDEYYGSEVYVDWMASYDISATYTMTIGVDNVFDNYPDKRPNAPDSSGRLYSSASPSSYNGGFYYIRLGFNF